MQIEQSRRRFLSNFALTGVVGLGGIAAVRLGGGDTSFAAEPPPEITTIRLEKDTLTCVAPQAAAEELLRAEGFSEVRFVEDDRPEYSNADMVGRLNEADFTRDFAPSAIVAIEQDQRITFLAGLHSGCFELFAKDSIRSIKDLKGKTVGASYFGATADANSGDVLLIRVMAASVGLDPRKDINWVTHPSLSPMQLFIDGRVDAFLAVSPEVQELRARKVGHVIASSITDQPWSQYYCCLVTASETFVHKYPIATKRVLRAILKAADLCASDPARIAQLLVERGYSKNYDYARQALSEIRYDIWREYDPEDSIPFYALRMYEAGLMKSAPQQLIAEHTDWRFLNELKRELKA